MSKAKKTSAASVKIAKDLKETRLHPVEGIYCELIDEADVFTWRIWFQGPGNTHFEGGLFCARMEFPEDYPMSPPKLLIESEFWHPNVYKDTGEVCISILHAPGHDEMSGERPEERWSPAQTVSTIMLSFLSLLSDPNFSSPANVDANIDMKDRVDVYEKKVKDLVAKSKQLAPPEIWGLIPHPDTDPEQAREQRERIKRELEPKEDNLDWMNPFGDHSEGDDDLVDFDAFDEDDLGEDFSGGDDGDYAEDDEDGGKEKEKQEEEKEEKEEKAQEDGGDAGDEDRGIKRKRNEEESDEEVDNLPCAAKRQKGQM